MRICRIASRDIVMRPRATASRAVTGLSPTSTIAHASPRGPTCDSARLSVACARRFASHRLLPARERTTGFRARPSGRRSSASRPAGTFSVPGEKFRIALMPAATTVFDDRLRRRRRARQSPRCRIAPRARRAFGTRGCRGSARRRATAGRSFAHGVEQRRDLETLPRGNRDSRPAPARGCRRP